MSRGPYHLDEAESAAAHEEAVEFAAKIQPDDMKKIVAYVRELAKQK